jgi:hypothetical protein
MEPARIVNAVRSTAVSSTGTFIQNSLAKTSGKLAEVRRFARSHSGIRGLRPLRMMPPKLLGDSANTSPTGRAEDA